MGLRSRHGCGPDRKAAAPDAHPDRKRRNRQSCRHCAAGSCTATGSGAARRPDRRQACSPPQPPEATDSALSPRPWPPQTWANCQATRSLRTSHPPRQNAA
ncbi:hypothetical protein MCRY_11565 [Marivita cryptomonadis]|nr:hypothetical protein MCRY_11565 [Marivita cryptomonadis]